MRRHRMIARISTGIVAAIAGVISWDATTTVAIHTHAVAPGLAWLVPGVIEAGVVALAITAWTAVAAGRRARLETWTAAGLLALSSVVQVAHTLYSGGGVLGCVISASVPLVLLVCSHSVVGDARRRSAARRSAPAQRARGEHAPARGRAQAGQADTRPASIEARSDAAPAGADREQILAQLAAQHGGLDRLTGGMVAEAVGVTPSTGRRILARARQQAGDGLAA